jgi:hypothetical protein
MDDFMSCYCKTQMCTDGSVSVSETTKNISILIVKHSIGSLFYLANISKEQNFWPLEYSLQVPD